MARTPASIADLVARGMEKAVEVGDCLEWQGAASCGGVTPCVKSREGKSYTANVPVCRVLWEAAHGPVPEGKIVYRKCCNNACVKLEHLRCGTRMEWKANQKKNGKTKHAAATKLKITASSRRRPTIVNTLDKAREVRALRAEKQLGYREISVATGVSEAMVADIVQGVAWRELIANPFAGLM